MEPRHWGQHDADCFACRIKSVQFSNVTAPPQRLMEKRWEKDLPAYKRLRKDGLQPKSTQHAHELEARATTQREIEMGRIISKKARKEVGSMIDDAQEVARKAAVTPNNEWAQSIGKAHRERG